MNRQLATALLIAAAVPIGAAQAQNTTVSVSDVECLPLKGNGVATATVEPDVAGSIVRLYFRRLNNVVEDFYYVEMRPSGNGTYWATFLQPEDTKLDKKKLDDGNDTNTEWADWWKAKEASEDRDPNNDLNDDEITEKASLGKKLKRDWMADMTNDQLETWLEQQKYESADYFVAVYDANGNEVARSPMKAVSVKDAKDCDVELTAQQEGFAENLTVGETAPWQKGDKPFHWTCVGLVTRIDPEGILRPDDYCRACVVAWWTRPELWLPAIGVVGGVIVHENQPEPVSPSHP